MQVREHVWLLSLRPDISGLLNDSEAGQIKRANIVSRTSAIVPILL